MLLTKKTKIPDKKAPLISIACLESEPLSGSFMGSHSFVSRLPLFFFFGECLFLNEK